jgi:predicted membrane protein
MLLNVFGGTTLHAGGRRVGELSPVLSAFGVVRLDLSDAVWEPGANSLALLSVFGAVEVLVPEDVGVYVEGITVFGGREILEQREGGLIASRDYESENYRSAAQRLNVVALSGWGALKIRRPPSLSAVCSQQSAVGATDG